MMKPFVLVGRVGDEIGRNVAEQSRQHGDDDREPECLPDGHVVVIVGEQLRPVFEREGGAVHTEIDIDIKGINQDQRHRHDDKKRDRDQRR